MFEPSYLLFTEAATRSISVCGLITSICGAVYVFIINECSNAKKSKPRITREGQYAV